MYPFCCCLFSDSAGPIVVHCDNGVDNCGMFAALCNILEKLQIDQHVDVAFAVKRLRQVRRNSIRTYNDYRMLHQAVATFILKDQNEYYNTA